MDDDDLKRAVLAQLLARAAAEGFTASLLRAMDTTAVFDGDLAAVLAFWSAEVDCALQTQLAAQDLASLSIRGRIRAGVLTRLAILKPHKDAARKAAALPQSLLGNAEALWRSADIIWRAAGDTATDFNFYSKRLILGGVLSTTMIAWFGDDSEDEGATTAFLDARIANVLQFEKLKARVQAACPSGNAS